jgi:hypothetical protein
MSGRRTPSPAMCVALLALFLALGGTTWAAVKLPARSVGTAQIRNDAVTGAKVKDHALTGADIKLSTLGAVPAAVHAATADLATHATGADTATHATTADSAGIAYSTHFETGVALPSTPTVIASLNLPAGSYVLLAKGQIDTFNNSDIVECDLGAGTDTDRSFGQGGSSHQSQILTNTVVHAFPTAGTVTLTCTGFSGGALSQVRLSAISVGSIAAVS